MRLSVKSALVTSTVVIAASIVILLSVTSMMRGELCGAIREQLDVRLTLEIQRVRAGLDGVAADARAIAAGPSLRLYLELAHGGRDLRQAHRVLDAALASVALSHPTYFQVRCIDATGKEQARVDRRNGKIVVVPESELQDKATHNYVRHMLTLESGRIYASPLNLNREHGVIERPFIPTLRIAVPVFDQANTRRGGIVINLDASQVGPPRRIGQVSVLMVNEAGYFLRHPDPSEEFGFDLGHHSTVDQLSPEAATLLGRQSSGIETVDRGLTTEQPEPIVFERFEYDPSDSSRYWEMIVAEPKAVAYAPIDALNHRMVILVLGVAAIACAIGWIVAYGVVKPIQEMATVARRITAGDLDAAVKVRGSDEVSLLGMAFNTMIDRLKGLISDEQRARMELAESNRELHRSNEELEQFAFAASHDLRTPLCAVAKLREWIATDLAEADSIPTDVQDHLEEIGKQVDRMRRLLKDLLEYGQVGKIDAKIRPFDPTESTHLAIALLQVPPTFKVDVAFERRTISGAPVEFELVVRNLVENAVKHHDRSTGTIRLSGTYRGGNFILEVADDGPGIPTAFHDRILKPFNTLKRRDECKGSGLGLALVNKIVQRWGGTLAILSEDGKRGTTFRVIMPITQCR